MPMPDRSALPGVQVETHAVVFDNQTDHAVHGFQGDLHSMRARVFADVRQGLLEESVEMDPDGLRRQRKVFTRILDGQLSPPAEVATEALEGRVHAEGIEDRRAQPLCHLPYLVAPRSP